MTPPTSAAPLPVPMFAAVRRVLVKGYGPADLRADVLAGLVVGVVALPLSMALAIAVGVPPQHGLYTAIFAGAVTAVCGGSKFQVTGPTAAFVVVLAPIVSAHGLSGLLTAGFLAGILLIVMGLTRMGSLIRFVPYPVTTGFTTGIAAVIATLQIKDLLGLQVGHLPDHYHEKVAALWAARGSFDLHELAVAVATFGLLLGLPRVIRRVPAPLLAIGGAAIGAVVAHRLWPSFEVATIGSRFSTVVNGVQIAGIPAIVPRPALPWSGLHLDVQLVRALLGSAFAIAMLGAIESLLSCVIADGLTGTRHEPNSELVGQGIGNLIAPLFGGIAATGALARTATAIRAGSRSPVAAVVHSLVVLAAMLLFAPLVGHVPMASLAALLLLVAWNMSDMSHFVGIVRLAPKSDVFVLFTCFFLTVFFDMVWAVSVGFLLAAVLFMRRMAEITEGRLTLDWTADDPGRPALEEGVAVYEVNGPLFFGAAHQAMESLHVVGGGSFRALVLDLGRVPVIDATGFVALRSTLRALRARGIPVVIAGPLPRPDRIWTRARELGQLGDAAIAETRAAALVLAHEAAAAHGARRTRTGRTIPPAT